MQTKITNYFKVMPEHTNWQPYNEKGNVIFGGVAMSQIDSAAAILTTMVLKHSDTAEYAVTWDSNFRFKRPVGTGDVLRIESQIRSFIGDGYNRRDISVKGLAGRTLEIRVDVFKECPKGKEDLLFGTANLTFVTKRGNNYIDHKLEKYESKINS